MGPESPGTPLLIDLVYELLDAHSDTMALAPQSPDPAWAAHTDYVRALQRRSREILAAGAQPASSTKPAGGAPAEQPADSGTLSGK